MTKFLGKSGRKLTGGRLKSNAEKKKKELGKPAALTTITSEEEDVRKKNIRSLGGTDKYRLYRAHLINVLNTETGKTSSVKIDDVVENSASKEFRRRDIITKGAILKTSLGNVKVTNRPGQEGHINGIIVKK